MSMGFQAESVMTVGRPRPPTLERLLHCILLAYSLQCLPPLPLIPPAPPESYAYLADLLQLESMKPAQTVQDHRLLGTYTPLRTDKWSKLHVLQDHPDQQYVAFLLRGMK